MKKLLEIINQYWSAVLILFGGISFIWGLVWQSILLPQIDSHIDNRVLKMADDSLIHMVDHIIKEKGSGFRGQLQERLGIDKDYIADSFAVVYVDVKHLNTEIKSLNYQKGVNKVILNNLFDKQDWEGVEVYLSPSGDWYYIDSLGLIWDATYKISEESWFYYPPYNNNKRTKCR